jgi:hypothetical protein
MTLDLDQFWKDRDLDLHNDNHNRFTCIFNIDEQTVTISRLIFNRLDLICAFGFVKNESNGSYYTEYDNLSFGVTVVNNKTKNIIASIDREGPISSDELIIEETTLSGFKTSDNDADHGVENTYTCSFWYEESGVKVEKTVTFTIIRTNYDLPETFERSSLNRMVYHPGYYPTDEEWESHQKYLEPGTIRPVAPDALL